MILPQNALFFIIFYKQILALYAKIHTIQMDAYISLQSQALAYAKNHVLVMAKELLDFGPIEKACVSYRHPEKAGRPAVYSISMLTRIILVGWLCRLSLRELENHLHTDLLMQWFIGWMPDMPLPDHTTIGRFELWLVYNQPDIYFATVDQQICAAFPGERKAVQIGDTYAMRANAADEGLVRRIRHICQRTQREAAGSMKEFENKFEGFDWEKLYGEKSEKLEVFLDKAGQAQRLEQTVLAALDFRERLEQLLASHPKKECRIVRGWCHYLDKVLADEVKVERDANGKAVKVTELPTKEKGEFRIISATDPEATLRVHGEQQNDVNLGNNIQVSASSRYFISETKAYTGSASDGVGVAALIEAQKARQEAYPKGCQEGQPEDCQAAARPGVELPSELLYDKAAGTGKVIADTANASVGQTILRARLVDYEHRSDRLGPYDFQLSEDGKTLTCPNGKQSITAYDVPQGGGRNFRFAACQCWQSGEAPKRQHEADLSLRCPLWEKCRGLKSGMGSKRDVFISDYRSQVLAAKAYNQTEEFQVKMKQRPQIERVIFELTNYNGARRCRRRGLAAADFQAKMCAVAYNVKLWARKAMGGQGRSSAATVAG